MLHQHSLEKSNDLARQALDRIHMENLPPTPENFELWYVYYSEENQDIRRAIELLEESGAPITNERCYEIHHQFLADNAENERVRQAGDKIQSTIKDVKGIVSNVKKATTQYSTRLSDIAERLGDHEVDQAEMQAVLNDVVSNTKDMIRQNELLEEKLSQSSQVMLDLQRDLEIVRKEALTDSLTALSNRKAFDTELRRIAKESADNGQTFSLIMLDIDHFKSFNDNFGHQVGDQVLRLVARTLTEGVKGRDVAARFGGEEFAIILPETNLQGSVKVADALRKAVAGKEVINRNTGDKLGRITMSGGVAEYLSGEDLEDLIGRADAALYTAKHNGRNQVSASPAPGQKKAAG